jgi:uncharacterized spore protein YtfJ
LIEKVVKILIEKVVIFIEKVVDFIEKVVDFIEKVVDFSKKHHPKIQKLIGFVPQFLKKLLIFFSKKKKVRLPDAKMAQIKA